MSLRTRLLLLVSLATLVPAILLGIRFFQNRAAEIETALVGLAAQANNIANDLDEKIQGTAQLQFGLARAVDLDSPNRAACSAFLSAVLQEYPQYTGILTITPDGSLFCDSLQTDRNLDLRDREYFQKALVTKDAVTLQPVFGRLTGTSVLQIAYPARSVSGQLKYVLLASFNLQQFANGYNARLSTTMDVLLLDKKGTVLVSPRGAEWAKRTGASIANSDLFRFVRDQSGGPTREVSDVDGRKHFWAAANRPAIRDAGLYVVVGISKDKLVAAADQRLHEDLFIVAMVSFFLIAGVWAVAEFGVRHPVGRIAKMAKNLGSGDLNVRIASPYPTGELGGLMIELNATADSLQRQRVAIDDLNQKLSQSQQTEVRTKVFLDTVIEHIPLPISVKVAPSSSQDARDWRITLVNKAYEHFAGISRAELAGKSARDIYSEDSADTIAASDDEALESTAALVVREFPLVAAGMARVVSAKKVAIRNNDGETQYLLTVLDDVTERRRSEQLIVHLAHHDALTDLPNRVLFREQLEQALKWVHRGEQVAVLYLDLDHFKTVNDSLGHPVGDELLKAVAGRLSACLKDTDTIARLGGDEFAIIQTAIAVPADITDLVTRIFAALKPPFEVNGHQLLAETSIGIAVAPNDGGDSDQLLKNADLAMYGAKADGRGTFRFFEPDMDTRVKARRVLEFELHQAIQRFEFELHYQPLVNLQDNTISGCEALLRWHHPKRGMVSPADFIPIAEETGLIVPIGEWVLRTACAQAVAWPDNIKIAVNVSPVQFKNRGLVQLVINALAVSGLAPQRLELEITEAVLVHDDAEAFVVLHQLREFGVRIAMDDFGTGYSSLSYLQRFPFDKIKIDQSFIKGVEKSADQQSIVQAVMTIAKTRNMTTTAEGVETEQQREILRSFGCTELQGYLFSPPISAAKMTELILLQREMDARVA